MAQVLLGTPAPITVATPASEEGSAGPDPGQMPGQVSLEWLEQPVDVPPLPPLAAARDDAGLMDAITGALTGVEGRRSVVVRNLEDGRSAQLNGSEVYYAASLYKMSILLEVFKQAEEGRLDLGRVVTLEPRHAEYDLQTLELLDLQTGDALSVMDAVRAMIVVSDTSTAVLLQELVGAREADETLRGLGMEDTSFNNRDLPATAADMSTLLQAIAGATGVSPEARTRMLQLLLQEGYKDGIAAGVPEGTPVAHKTGSYADATHDVALVWGPGGPYTIAVMSDQPNNWPAVAAVSKAVWDYFAANP